MPLIQVANQSRIKINPGLIKNAAKRTLDVLGYTEAELSILIVDDKEMARLNQQYRRIDHATDVLSFPMLEGEFGDIAPQMMGDVVICAQSAGEISKQSGTALQSVLDVLLVHGILHLLGLDHEAGPAVARQMRLKTEELLTMLGHGRDEFEWFFEE
ncbi:MAG TPA: rRNA maturation RNase YbeY [Syntrophobacteraceae bacterium]|nr:rRNA maturation RNase YbeY [Syntrophobacteraceae bacterium]